MPGFRAKQGAWSRRRDASTTTKPGLRRPSRAGPRVAPPRLERSRPCSGCFDASPAAAPLAVGLMLVGGSSGATSRPLAVASMIRRAVRPLAQRWTRASGQAPRALRWPLLLRLKSSTAAHASPESRCSDLRAAWAMQPSGARGATTGCRPHRQRRARSPALILTDLDAEAPSSLPTGTVAALAIPWPSESATYAHGRAVAARPTRSGTRARVGLPLALTIRLCWRPDTQR